MTRQNAPARWFFLAILILACSGASRADFVEVENFETLNLGPIDEQNDWRAVSDSSMVVLDPADTDNQALSVITESTVLSKPTLLQNGTIRMVFLRFRFDDQLSCSFGLSDAQYPTQFDHFEVELSLTNTRYDLRINDGGTYDVLTVLEPRVWYNCWLLIDNVDDETTVWLHTRAGDSATSDDQLSIDGQTAFDFRDPNANDIKNFYIKTGGGNGVAGPLLIDDIYMEDTDALNLQYPGAIPTAVAELSLPPRNALLSSYPNPFNPTTTIRFHVSEPMDGNLAVFDARGGRLASLVTGVMTPGWHEVVWRGRDEAGQPVGSGVYFVRLRVGEHLATGRLHLLK